MDFGEAHENGMGIPSEFVFSATTYETGNGNDGHLPNKLYGYAFDTVARAFS